MSTPSADLWSTLEPHCAEAARRHGVVPDLHPLDFIFRFLLDHPGFADHKGRVDYYFDDGARSAGHLARIIRETCGLEEEGLRLLEFASGYGCVTRHLGKAIPEVASTSCDIHAEAVEFLERIVGVPALPSDAVPERLEVGAPYDVVFALSFFSHMPKTTWARWLRALTRVVAPGGYLIFTTHGPTSGERHLGAPRLDGDGFWFRPASEQKDLDVNQYGTTVTAPAFVRREVVADGQLSLVTMAEGFWWQHQDLYVTRRDRA